MRRPACVLMSSAALAVSGCGSERIDPRLASSLNTFCGSIVAAEQQAVRDRDDLRTASPSEALPRVRRSFVTFLDAVVRASDRLGRTRLPDVKASDRDGFQSYVSRFGATFREVRADVEEAGSIDAIGSLARSIEGRVDGIDDLGAFSGVTDEEFLRNAPRCKGLDPG